jgi:NADH dehydrogenase
VPDCSLPGHPEIFAVGDMISLNQLPGVAQPAIQEGKYVGKLIRAGLRDRTTAKPFRYRDKGSMATIGHLSAVTDSFAMKFTGVIGVHDVGLRPRALPGRLGRPAGGHVHLGPR